MSFASGSQLTQSRPSGTSAVTLFTATLGTEVTSLVLANTTGSAATYSIYHDNAGTTYSEATALVFGASLAANTTVTLFASPSPGCGLTISSGGSVGVKSGTGSAITYTLYGVTEARR
jgi:hypothetical protein